MFFLDDIVIIIGLSAAVLYLCHRLELPTIVGYLLTGLLTGPYGFKLVGNPEAVMKLAEIGVVALLFTIGLEFSFRNLVQLRRTALLGGDQSVSDPIGMQVDGYRKCVQIIKKYVDERVEKLFH